MYSLFAKFPSRQAAVTQKYVLLVIFRRWCCFPLFSPALLCVFLAKMVSRVFSLLKWSPAWRLVDTSFVPDLLLLKECLLPKARASLAERLQQAKMCLSAQAIEIWVKFMESSVDGYSLLNASASISSQASNMNQERRWTFYIVYQMKRRS